MTNLKNDVKKISNISKYMQTQKIFKVKIDGISAELEINDISLSCVTGETVHFDVSHNNIRAYEFQKPDKIVLDIYKNSKMYFIKMTSKYSVEIIETIKTSVN